MALDVQITKEQFNALEDYLKAHYIPYKDGYALDGLVGLIDNKDSILEEKKRVQAEKDALQAEKNALKAEIEAKERERQIKDGDVKSLTEGYEAKLKAAQDEAQAKISAADRRLETILVDNVAMRLAASIAGESAALLLPHIKPRLKMVDGQTKVCSASGELQAMSIEELENEFRNNKTFAPIVKSKDGAGMGGVSSDGKGAVSTKGMTNAQLAQLTEREIFALKETDPELYSKAIAIKMG